MRLIFVGQITNLTCYVSFGHTSCVVQDHTEQKIGAGRKAHGLYQLEYLHLPLPQFLSATSKLWHRRLGHPSEARSRTLSNYSVLGKSTFSPSNKCESRHLAKQTVVSFTPSIEVSLECFDLIHFDV